MDYEAEDKWIHRKIMTEALQRVGATITRNDVTGYLNIGCDDRDELEFALQGAEIMRREAETDFARRNYYNIECALANKLRTTTKKGKCQNCKGRGSIRFGRGITRTTEGCPDCGGTGQTLKIL